MSSDPINFPLTGPIDSKDQYLQVHSFETFGTHDGPGIRLVVFVQGCQFRCIYCANPDAMSISGGKMIALDEIVEMADKQKPYFGPNGGVTISGGEPLLQRERLTDLFGRLQERGIHTALDSNGRLLDEAAKNLLDRTDLLLLDVKHIDNEWHRKLTSVPNDKVLEVAAHREATGKPMWLRYVLVPGWTDQPEYLHRLGQHFGDYRTIEKIEIQPFHQLGKHKWAALGMDYQLGHLSPASAHDVAQAEAIFRQYFREVKVN
jgi:pyruvate formate lyase activating enzyme